MKNAGKCESVSPFKDRLMEFISHLGLSVLRFEKEAQLPNATVRNIKTSLKEPNIDKIKKRYPELNVEWLKTGDGEMINEGDVTSTSEYNDFVLAVLVDEIASLKATAKGSLFVDERDAIMTKIERATGVS